MASNYGDCFPTARIEMPELPAAIFRNGAAASFRAKQMSVDIFSRGTAERK
jgi:hypothetical protein